MTTEDKTPATKKDVKVLERKMKLYVTDFASLFASLSDKIETAKEDTKHYFDLKCEQLVHDFLGAHKDQIELHEDRIAQLEHHVGLPS